MIVRGTPAHFYRVLRRFSPDPFLIHRIAVRGFPGGDSRVLLATEHVSDDETFNGFFDIGRIGVLEDCGRRRVLLILHDAVITPEPIQNVANVTLLVTRGECVDILLDPAAVLLGKNSPVTLCATDNGGNSWETMDVSNVLSDFFVHGDGDVTVRCGDRAVCMTAHELIDIISLDRPAVNGYGTMLVSPNHPLVHFTRPEIDNVKRARVNRPHVAPPLESRERPLVVAEQSHIQA